MSINLFHNLLHGNAEGIEQEYCKLFYGSSYSPNNPGEVEELSKAAFYMALVNIGNRCLMSASGSGHLGTQLAHDRGECACGVVVSDSQDKP